MPAVEEHTRRAKAQVEPPLPLQNGDRMRSMRATRRSRTHQISRALSRDSVLCGGLLPARTITCICAVLLAFLGQLLAADETLQLSVYATAGDVVRFLSTPAGREQVEQVLKPLRVSHLFLEGRRGDEAASRELLKTIRDFFEPRGIHCSGGIATVLGNSFGTRQLGGLSWLNWESEKTRRDVAQFFAEDAPVFDELIVDDFYCTGDASPESALARGTRSWSEYRQDLLVSLIDPLVVQPAHRAHPSVRLIIKYPQWYDRFQLFGYDPVRMSAHFDQVWVGTEVRDPKTRRMGFVQPTEGYINFRWIASVAGPKVRGAWFDHIECSAQNFLDQAAQSVLAGAEELTLFNLGDVMGHHPGDVLLASRWPQLVELAGRIRNQRREGIAFYKSPGSVGNENLYLADYLAMIGLPILPCARYPDHAKVAFLPVQAATDTELLEKMRRHLANGATLVLTPALVRVLGEAGRELAGVQTGPAAMPSVARGVVMQGNPLPLPTPLELDEAVAAVNGRVLVEARLDDRPVPFLIECPAGQGRVFVLNVRTFSEDDFRNANEVLLAPLPRGLPEIPQALADSLRAAWLPTLGVELSAPAGVGLSLFGAARCVYNFHDRPLRIQLDGQALNLEANGCRWVAKP